MSEADKDGRITQMVADMHFCLSMSIHENLRESAATFNDLLDGLPDDEEFCPDCFAGMESSEHFEKCERPAREQEGGS